MIIRFCPQTAEGSELPSRSLEPVRLVEGARGLCPRLDAISWYCSRIHYPTRKSQRDLGFRLSFHMVSDIQPPAKLPSLKLEDSVA